MKTQDNNTDNIKSDILYALDAVSKYSDGIVSKIAIQKILYLVRAFSPIKNIILDYLRFHYQIHGPWSKEIQNGIDRLVGEGFVKAEYYKKTDVKHSRTDYMITSEGKVLVKDLITIDIEKEKHWWISSIARLCIIYSNENYKTKWNGLDKIADLVYQEPTFANSLKKYKKKNDSNKYKNGFRKRYINFERKNNTIKELIEFINIHFEKYSISIKKENEYQNAEIILANFFEFLFVKILSKNGNRRKSKAE